MTEQGTCQGCCLNPGFINPNLFNPFFGPLHSDYPVNILDRVKLTSEETELLKKLGESYNMYCNLNARSEADNKEFMDALHRLQQIIALRVARRVNPEVWAQPE